MCTIDWDIFYASCDESSKRMSFKFFVGFFGMKNNPGLKEFANHYLISSVEVM